MYTWVALYVTKRMACADVLSLIESANVLQEGRFGD
jgi:hypothetical protein